MSNFAKAPGSASPDLESRGLPRQHDQMARDLDPAIEKVSEQIAKLTLIADRDGQVMGVPHHETVGQWLKPGKPFCEVADPHRLEAHMIIDQADIDLIRVNRPRLDQGLRRLRGDLEEPGLARSPSGTARRSPPSCRTSPGRDRRPSRTRSPGQAKPLTAVYEVIIPVDNPDLALQPGLRGFAKIDGGTHTFGWWLWRLLAKTFHFTL